MGNKYKDVFAEIDKISANNDDNYADIFAEIDKIGSSIVFDDEEAFAAGFAEAKRLGEPESKPIDIFGENRIPERTPAMKPYAATTELPTSSFLTPDLIDSNVAVEEQQLSQEEQAIYDKMEVQRTLRNIRAGQPYGELNEGNIKHINDDAKVAVEQTLAESGQASYKDFVEVGLPKRDISSDDLLEKEKIRSYFSKSEDGSYILPNGSRIYSDALLDKYIDDYYKQENHPILMQTDAQYRKNFIEDIYKMPYEEYISKQADTMQGELDKIQKSLYEARTADYAKAKEQGVPMQYQHMMVDPDIDDAQRYINDIKSQIDSFRKNGFWQGLKEGFNFEDTLMFGIPGIATDVEKLNALRKFAKGDKLTPAEQLFIDLSKLEQSVEDIRSAYRGDDKFSWNSVGNILGQMPEFMVQMATASKVAPSIAKEFVERATAKVVANTFKKSIGQGLKMGLKNAGAGVVNDALMTPLMGSTWKGYTERRLQGYEWNGDKLDVSLNSVGLDILKSLGQNFAEVHSERVGEWISSGLVLGGRKLAQTKFLRRMFGDKSHLFDYKLPPVLNKLRRDMRISGYAGEVAGELWNNIITPLVTGETDSWKELGESKYWWELLASTAIMSGSFYSMSVPGAISYSRNIKQLQKAEKVALNNIEDEELKQLVTFALSEDNVEQGLNFLSEVPWRTLSPNDVKYISEYVYHRVNEQMLRSEEYETDRLNAFTPYLQNIASGIYQGIDVENAPLSTKLVEATMADGRRAYILSGDYNDLQGEGIIIGKFTDTGAPAPLDKSEIREVRESEMSDYIAELYALMFSRSINKEKLNNYIEELQSLRESGATPEQIGEWLNRSGYVFFETGSPVTLVNGVQGTVESYRGDGSYVIRHDNGESYLHGFQDILQPDPATAEAQVERNAEAEVKAAEDTIANEQKEYGVGDYVTLVDNRAVEIDDTSYSGGTQYVVHDIQTDESFVIDPKDIIGLYTPDVEGAVEGADKPARQIPTDKDGDIDFEAIDDAQLLAELLPEKSKGKEKAIDILQRQLASMQQALSSVKAPTTLNEEIAQMEQIEQTKNRIKVYEEAIALLQPESTESSEQLAKTEEKIDASKVQWDKLSPEEYAETFEKVYGAPKTIERNYIYYNTSRENLAQAKVRVAKQAEIVKNLERGLNSVASPIEEQALQAKIDKANQIKVQLEGDLDAIRKQMAKYAYAMKKYGVEVATEDNLLAERARLEEERNALLEADKELDRYEQEEATKGKKTIANTEANRKYIEQLYADRFGVSPAQAGPRQAILWDLANGAIKLRWDNATTDSGAVQRGLQAELGVRGTEERRAYKAVIDNKNGQSVDAYVHDLWQNGEWGPEISTEELKDELLGVLQSTPNGSLALKELADMSGVQADLEAQISLGKGDIQRKLEEIDANLAKNALQMADFRKRINDTVQKLESGEPMAKKQPSNRLTEQQASDIIRAMQVNAEVAREIELTPENWRAEFGEDNIVKTPIGEVKMGEHQYFKLLERQREGYFGMIKPTLANPDIVLEESAPEPIAERDSKYLFVKTFVKNDGSRYVHFESVTVQKDSKEVSISSHEIDQKGLLKKMHNDNVVHLKDSFLDSEWRLTEPSELKGSDLVPTPNSSESKDTTSIPKNQISEEEFFDNAPISEDIPKVLSLEQYLGELGLSSPMSDYMIDKTRQPHLRTQSQKNKFEKEAKKAMLTYAQQREQAIVDYKKLVDEGRITPPSNIDRLIASAHGHNDLESTQAARRQLTKRGIDWESGLPKETPFMIEQKPTEKPMDTAEQAFIRERVEIISDLASMGPNVVTQTHEEIKQTLSEYKAGADGAKNYVIFNANDVKIVAHIQYLKTPQGIVYGFTIVDTSYIDIDELNPETPVHEYTEWWSKIVAKNNPKLWARGKELLKETDTWKEVNEDPNYKDLSEDLRASETLSRIAAKEAGKKMSEVSDNKSLIAKLRAWIRKFWGDIKATFAKWSKKDLQNLTVNQFSHMPLRDLFEGVDLRKYRNAKVKSHKQAQLDIIKKHNPMQDDVHTGIRKVEDIKSFDEVLGESRKNQAEYGELTYPDMNIDMMESAAESGMITVYSSYPIKQGVFVTPSYMNAQDYAGGSGRVYQATVPVDDIAWIAEDEGQYARVETEPMRPMIVGEKGAANLDAMEEATTRLDNLAVAREMEEANRDAKAIKLATGWERGADGKWRYETQDFITRGGFTKVVNNGTAHNSYVKSEMERINKQAEWLKEILDGLNADWVDEHIYGKSEPTFAEKYPEKAQEMKDYFAQFANKDKAQKEFNRLMEYAEVVGRLGKNEYMLDEFVEDKSLFSAYPSLRNVKVVIEENSKQKYGGNWNKEKRSITIVNYKDRGLYEHISLLHEVQHAIQDLEGFAQGGSPEIQKPDTEDAKRLREIVRRAISFVEFFQNEDIASVIRDSKKYGLPQWKSIGKESQDVLLEYLGNKRKVKYEDIRKYLDNAFNMTLPRKYGKAGYKKFAGEVEARNVGIRKDMTPEERRATLLSETEDVAREDQIFLENNLGVAQSVEVSEPIEAPSSPQLSDEEKVEISKMTPTGRFNKASELKRRGFSIEDIAEITGWTYKDGRWLSDIKTQEELDAQFKEEEKVRAATFDLLQKRFGYPAKLVRSLKDVPRRNKKDASYFDSKSGEIVIVIPNVPLHSTSHATYFIEAAAQKGLDKLFGVNYDNFIEQVYSDLTTAEQAILTTSYGTNKRVSIEKLLNKVADGNESIAMTENVGKSVDVFMRNSYGLKLALSPQDVKTLLAVSKAVTTNADTALAKAEKRLAQKKAKAENIVSEDTKRLTLDSEGLPIEVDADSFNRHNTVDKSTVQAAVKTFLMTTFVDATIPLERMQKSLAKLGVMIDPLVNYHDAMNRMASIYQRRRELHNKNIVEPMIATMRLLMAQLNITDKFLNDYCLAEHSKERHGSGINAIGEDGAWTLPVVENILREFESRLHTMRSQLLRKEGVSVLTESEKEFISKDTLDRFSIHGYDKLTSSQQQEVNEAILKDMWNKIRITNRASLNYLLEAGLRSKEQIDTILKHGWKYYVPLMDHAADAYVDPMVAFDLEHSYTGSGNRNVKMHKAEGRKSKAADPIPYMIQFGERCLLAAEENLSRQYLLRLVERGEAQLGNASEAFWRRPHTWARKVYYDNGRSHWVKLATSEWPTDEQIKVARETERDIIKLKQSLAKIVADLKTLGAEWSADEHRYFFPPIALTNGVVATKGVSLLRDWEQKTKELITLQEAQEFKEYNFDTIAFNSENPIKSAAAQQDKTVSIYRNGERIDIVFADPTIAHAVNNGSRGAFEKAAAQLLQRLKIATLTRFRSAVSTSYNPEFLLVNFTRDFGLASTLMFVGGDWQELKEFEKTMFGGISGAFRKSKGHGIWGAVLRGIKLEGNPLSVADLKGRSIHSAEDRASLEREYGTDRLEDTLFEYFSRAGGITGFASIREIEQIEKEVTAALMQAEGSKRLNKKRAVANAIKNVGHLGEAMEVITRFAIFEANIKSGKPIETAVMRAKNLTANFNRSGSASGMLGSLFIFFNAAVQGLYSVLKESTKSKKHMARASFAIAAYSAIGGFNYWLSKMFCDWMFDDDDEDKGVPEYIFGNNIIIPLPGLGIYLKTPIAPTWRVFTGIGVQVARLFMGEIGMQEFGSKVLNLIASETIPNYQDTGSGNLGHDIIRTLFPSILQPIYDVATNTDAFGRPIHKEDKFGQGIPDSQLGMSNVNIIAKYLALWLNAGNEYKAIGVNADGSINPFINWFDINPSNMQYLFEQYLGGVGTFLSRIEKTGMQLAQQEEMAIRDWPFLNRFVGEMREPNPSPLFYDDKENADRMNAIYRRRLKAGDITSSDPEYQLFHKRYLRLKGIYGSIVQPLRKQIKENGLMPGDTEYERIQEQIQNAMKAWNSLDKAVKDWNMPNEELNKIYADIMSKHGFNVQVDNNK